MPNRETDNKTEKKIENKDKANGKDKVALTVRIATVLGLLLVAVFALYGYKNGIFESSHSFSSYILSFGISAALIFTLVQAIQVIIPILPGAIGCIAGVFAFGPVWGLIYSYIGICIGSLGAFLISKHFGIPIARKFIGGKKMDKYVDWLDKGKKFDKFFTLAILAPVAPDDILCFIAGLTKMSLKKFSIIILLCKPPAIAAYSLAIAGFISLTGF